MNYLAHLRLSAPDAESMVGNLMGDFRKYLRSAVLPELVSRGIANHVRVDRFTDSNLQVLNLKRLFSPARRRFAGIIVDVSFDHFLIRHWQQFSDEDLEEFIDHTHHNISSLREIMPRHMQHAMDYMIRENWLRSYANLDGISFALNRMSSRIRFENKLSGAIEEVEQHYEELEQGFLQFFPELLEHVETHKELV